MKPRDLNFKFLTNLAALVLMAALCHAQASGPVGGQAETPQAKEGKKAGKQKDRTHLSPRDSVEVRKTTYLDLGLKTDQQKKIDELEAKLAADYKAIRKDLGGGKKGGAGNQDEKKDARSEAKEKLKGLMTKFMSDLGEILDKDQLRKFKEKYAENAKKYKEKLDEAQKGGTGGSTGNGNGGN